MIVTYKLVILRWKECLLMFVSKISGIIHATVSNNPVMLYCYPNYFQFIDSQKADFALFKLSTCTNLDIKDPACLHIVHILQHQTSCPITNSTQSTMVNAAEKNFSPLPAGKYGKLTTQSTWQRYQAKEGNSGLAAQKIRALGVLHSLRLRHEEKCTS